MKKCKEILIGVLLLSMVFFTACTSKAAKAMEKVELGQKYLTELNYTEAVASFTEAIGLDPENISAYMGRAEAYVGLKQYDDAKTDYTTAIEKAVEQPYTRAEAYVGRAEVNEVTNANEAASSVTRKALAISRFAEKLLPEPGVPKIRPLGFFSFFRSTMIRLLDRAFSP